MKKSLNKGHSLGVNDVYFAMPCQENQIYSGDLRELF